MPLSVSAAILWGAAFALAATPGVRPADPSGAKSCKVEQVRPEQGERRARFIGWLKTHRAKSDWPEETDFEGPEPRIDNYLLHIVDIDNDGRDEYVLSDVGGTANILAFSVFRPSGDGWTPEETPFEPGIREWAEVRPRGLQLFVRFCGKTYVNLLGGQGPNYFRDTQIWEGSEVRPVCDAPWLKEQRRYFQSLFDHKLYDEAYAFLAGARDSCKAAEDRETLLWMESDLALTGFKMGTYDTCLGHVAAARKSPGFASAGKSLRRALAANATLCGKAKAKGPSHDYDFSWLRELGHDPETPYALDPRFNGLLSAVAPDVRLEDGELFRDVLKLGVWVPEPTRWIDKRYVLLSGGEPHNPGNRGFIWIDMVTRRSIVGNTQVMGSKTFRFASVPHEFWDQLGRHGIQVKYLEPGGEWREIETP
jgi:hypothetical protein